MTSTSRVRLSVACALLAASGGLQAGQGLSVLRAETPVASSTVTAAQEGSVGAFARALARERATAGVVVVTRQQLRPTPPSAGPAAAPGRLEDAVSAFVARHGTYRVSESNDAILVAPESSPCLGPLRRSLLDIRLDGPAFQIGYELVKRVSSDLPQAPPGLVGAQLGSLMRQRVSLYFAERTLKELLDEISRQVPGIVWGVIDDKNQRTGGQECLLHWFLPDGSAATSYNLWSAGNR